jgi:hypothetical protein
MLNIPLTLGIGAALGLLGAIGIYFDPRVPGKHAIVAAGLLRGALVALLIGLSISEQSGWLVGGGYGALYGVLFGTMICLSKGTGALQHAIFIIPSTLVTGALSGIAIALWAI